MPPHFLASLSRAFLVCATLIGSFALSATASAQMAPPQAGPPATPVNPICVRLETQLATIDRGSNDPAKDEQIRRFQDAAVKQQAELDRLTAQARRMGCDSSGFFSLFSGQSAQCGPVNSQIQQMRANLDQMTNSLERLRSGGIGAERDNQRRSVLTALGQNGCGPQYAQFANAATGPGNFFSALFGGNSNPNVNMPPPVGPDMASPSGTYRTVCVRSCDGGYFPISFATVPARFPDDERTCKALCPATEATLYTYPNPGGDINQAVSFNGQPYTALPNAFRYRTEYNPSCSCKAPGQTWAEALKAIDDKAAAVQQGDIIVTEESAKKMQQRTLAKPAPASAKKGVAPATAAATTPATGADATASAPSASTPSENKQIRTVGPTFIPAH
jgi:hypothetical protein